MKYAIMYARNLADSENVVPVEEPSPPVVAPVAEPVVESVVAPVVEPVLEQPPSTPPVLENPPDDDDEIPPETVSPTFTLDSVYPPDDEEF